MDRRRVLDGIGRQAGGLGEFRPAFDRCGDLGVNGVELAAAHSYVGCHGSEGGLARRRPKGVWRQPLIVAALVGVLIPAARAIIM